MTESEEQLAIEIITIDISVHTDRIHIDADETALCKVGAVHRVLIPKHSFQESQNSSCKLFLLINLFEGVYIAR